MTDTPTPGAEPSWAKPAIAAGSTLCFAMLTVAAYLRNDTQTLAILTGVASALLTQVGNFYFGSSSGSLRKTELLASAPPVTSKGSTQ